MSPEAPTGVARSAIVGGEPTSDSSFVVRIRTCSGTIVAPNLVLTARHCVANLDAPSFVCDANGDVVSGGGRFEDPHPIGLLTLGPEDAPIARSHAKRVIASDGTTMCGTDLAFVVIDPPLADDVPVARLRLDGAPAIGDPLRVAGWGIAIGAEPASTLHARDVSVLAVGPSPARDGGPEAVPTKFFAVGEGPCYGDSGSPALAHDRVVVGVASAAGRPSVLAPTGVAADCIGADARGFYESLAAEKDFVLSAFAEAGAKPWLEGAPDPRAPSFDAGVADGGTTAAAAPADDGGCAAGGAASWSPAVLVALVVALGLIALRRGKTSL